MENQPTMPPEIAAAIVKVMTNVKRLHKSEKNKHEGYNFVSVDAFYEAVNPLCAEAGLAIWLLEKEVESFPPAEGRKAGTLRVTCEVIAVHSSGAVWSFGDRVTTVIAQGPQAFAAAHSFIQKYFMRGLFMIPTGEALEDIEADAQPKENIPQFRKTRGAAAKTAGKSPEERISAFISEAQEDLKGFTSGQELIEWEAKNGAKLVWLRENAPEMSADLRTAIEARYDDFADTNPEVAKADWIEVKKPGK